MKNKKSLLSKIALFSLLAFVATGCSSKETAKDAGNDQAKKQTEEKKTEEKPSVIKGKFTTNIDMSSYEKGKIVKVWIPMAKSDDNQAIANEKINIDTSHAKTETNTDALGNKILYVEWDKDATDRKVNYTFDVERNEIKVPELVEKDEELSAEVKEYLKPSSTVPVDGKVKELAEKITNGKKTDLEKTRAIYDWIIANMNRDDDVIGCGLGEVETLLGTKEGKCTDIHSVFVALNRAVGIPAREMFGVRLGKDAGATDVTKAQHCWTQFYLKGTGWVYADPADVLKAVLKNKWTKDQKETKDLQEYYFGNIDPIRVEVAQGRDLKLTPAQAGEPLNNFGYPYGEVDGQKLDFYKPDTFKYTLTFEKAE